MTVQVQEPSDLSKILSASSAQSSFVKVSASLLSANSLNYAEEMERVHASGADFFHIDVMDGYYVPNASFGVNTVNQLKKYAKIPFDVHLMVDDADRFIDFYTDAADLITIHPETTKHVHRTLSLIRAKGKKAGIALNPGTPLSVLDYILPGVDLVLIMAVNPGFGGQEFIPETLQKIADVRRMADEKKYTLEISVDGGVTDRTAPDILKAGANILVSGSYLFKHASMYEGVTSLKKCDQGGVRFS